MTSLWNSLQAISYLLLALLLALTVIEDFKYRAVKWWIFPLLGLISITIEYPFFNLVYVFINGSFILIQIAMLSLYFSIKEKKVIMITKTYLGWGDILFWIVLCLLFSPLNFILFFMGSMFLVTVASILWKVVKRQQVSSPIPLAGMQAFLLLVLIVVTKLSASVSFRNDVWIEKWLMG